MPSGSEEMRTATGFTAGVVAKRTGVPAHTVRWYLRQKLLRPRRNPRNGYYEFTGDDLKALNFVRRAKALGFTLKEIASIFEMSRTRQTPCPMVRDIVARRILDFEADIKELRSMQRGMKQAMKVWRRLPDGAPDGDEICRLIEATGTNGDIDLGVARKLRIGNGRKTRRIQKMRG